MRARAVLIAPATTLGPPPAVAVLRPGEAPGKPGEPVRIRIGGAELPFERRADIDRRGGRRSAV